MLARLHMDLSAITAHLETLKLVLNQLPKTIRETYEERIHRVRKQRMNDARLAQQILSWNVLDLVRHFKILYLLTTIARTYMKMQLSMKSYCFQYVQDWW